MVSGENFTNYREQLSIRFLGEIGEFLAHVCGFGP